MPTYNPNEPQNGEVIDADLLRNQLNSLKDLIDAVPAGPPGPQGPQGETGPQGPQGVPGPGGPETDPVFAASEAAQFVPGDKAKLDTALQTEIDPIFFQSEAAKLVPGDKAKLDTAVQAGDNVSALTNDTGYLTPTTGMVRGQGGMPFADMMDQHVRTDSSPQFIEPTVTNLISSGDHQIAVNVQQRRLQDDLAVAADWTGGVLRDSAGNAFVASPVAGLTRDVTIGGVTLHFTNGLLTGVS